MYFPLRENNDLLLGFINYFIVINITFVPQILQVPPISRVTLKARRYDEVRAWSWSAGVGVVTHQLSSSGTRMVNKYGWLTGMYHISGDGCSLGLSSALTYLPR